MERRDDGDDEREKVWEIEGRYKAERSILDIRRDRVKMVGKGWEMYVRTLMREMSARYGKGKRERKIENTAEVETGGMDRRPRLELYYSLVGRWLAIYHASLWKEKKLKEWCRFFFPSLVRQSWWQSTICSQGNFPILQLEQIYTKPK